MTPGDDLEERLEDLERRYGLDDDQGRTVISLASASSVADEFTVTTELGEEDPIDSYEEIVVPHHLPRHYLGGVAVLTGEKIEAVWRKMPADVRERELEYRLEHGEPVPPVLQE